MKRIGTPRICNGQSHGGAGVEWLLTPAKPAGPVATDQRQSTLTDDHRQAWGQDLWPDCSD
jgi:hypothetical protein